MQQIKQEIIKKYWSSSMYTSISLTYIKRNSHFCINIHAQNNFRGVPTKMIIEEIDHNNRILLRTCVIPTKICRCYPTTRFLHKLKKLSLFFNCLSCFIHIRLFSYGDPMKSWVMFVKSFDCIPKDDGDRE